MRLIAFAVVLVAAVVGGQFVAGGGDFVPSTPAGPCVNHAPRATDSLEALAERVVVDGLAEAACELGVSRERLLLDLGTGAQVDPEVLRSGLDRAVGGIDDLPPVSALLDEALELTSLPGIAKDAIRAVPDGVIDDLLPTEALLRRAVSELDVQAVLDDLDDPEGELRDALLEAAVDQAVESLSP